MAQNTVAAGRAWIYSHNVGRNAQAGMGFNYPIGVAPAKNGVLFVVSRGTEGIPGGMRISKVTIDHQFINEFGRPEEGKGEFIWLAAVALDRDENVYAADEWLNRITVFDNAGILLQTWGEPGEGEGQLSGACGMAFDADDKLYVVNSHNSRIQKFTKDGRYLSGFGQKGNGEGELDMPWGITVAASGDVFVVDWNNHRVQKFGSDGTWLGSFGHGGTGAGSLNHPSGVAVDAEGDVYVVDSFNERVVIFDPGARPLAYLTGDAVDLSPWGQLSIDANADMAKARRRVNDLEQQQRAFRVPTGVAFDRATNRLIVCDTQRGRLQIYEKDNHYHDPQANL